MNDPLLVRRLEAFRDLASDLDRLVHGNRSAPEPLRERSPSTSSDTSTRSIDASASTPLWAISRPLIFHGAELKQYSSDILASILLTLVALDLRAYPRELDGFRGKPRVWVFFARSIPALQEQGTILGYLEHIGVRRDRIVPPARGSDAEAVLYDLSLPDHQPRRRSVTKSSQRTRS